MTIKTIRALGLALLIGGALVPTSGIVSPDTGIAATIKNQAVGRALKEAQELARSGRWREAIAKAREAEAVPGKSASESATINQFIAYAAVKAGDYGTALNTYDRMIAAGQVDRTSGLKTAMQLALTMGNASRAMQYANQLGDSGVGKLAFASLYYQSGNYREVIRMLRPGAESAGPDALELLRSAYYKIGDRDGAQYALELLVRSSPTPQRWRDLLRNAEQRSGLTDHQLLDIYRIKFMTGSLQGESEYLLLAKLALQYNLPNEAKTVLTKGFQAKTINVNERNQRLMDVATAAAAKDQASLARLDAQARAQADGEADIKLGEDYIAWNRAADAVAAIQRGIKKDKLKDPDDAKIRLGRAFLAQGNRGEAVRAFNSVPRSSKQSPIARIWSIYAQRG